MFQIEQQAIEDKIKVILSAEWDSPRHAGMEAHPFQRGVGHFHFIFCHAPRSKRAPGKKWSCRSGPRKLPNRSRMRWHDTRRHQP